MKISKRRWAAILAIAALAVAFGLTISFLVSSFLKLVLVVLSVAIGAAAAFAAITRGDRVRFVAWAVAALAAWILVLVVMDDPSDFVRILIIAALTAGSVGLARYALGLDASSLRAGPTPGVLVGPTERGVLIMNPRSGGGKAERFNLVDEARRRGIKPIVLHPGDDLVQLAINAIQEGAEVIGMAGGDGSQALVATAASQHGVPHVCLPAGTRNHFALDLGLDRDDLIGALDAYADGVERAVDLATVNDRVFVNNVSLGIYANIVQSDEYRDAKAQTAVNMLPDLLGPEAEAFDLQFNGPDGTRYPTAHLILVSNNPYQLVSLFGRGTRQVMDTGALGVVAARIDGPGEVARLVALEAAGQISRFPGWMQWTAGQFTVESSSQIAAGIDGEALVLDPPLRFAALPGALRVRLPHHAPGLSPAAIAAESQVTVDNAKRLWAVARNRG